MAEAPYSGTSTTTTTVEVPYGDPTTSGQYAADLIAALGAPETDTNREVMTAWVDVESKNFPGWNGLGTELALPGATPDPSNPQVYDYPNLAEGLEAAVDMMTGTAPQTTALAPQFVKDLRSGDATQATLVADVRASGWDGSPPDTYDANAIEEELAVPGEVSIFLLPTGSLWDPLNWLGDSVSAVGGPVGGAVGGAVVSGGEALGSSLISEAWPYILKGLAALAGAGLIIGGLWKAAEPRMRQSAEDLAPLALAAAA